MKKVLIGVITAGLVLVGATSAIAATFKSPAEIYAGLKGVTVDEAYAAKATGTTYGQLASEAGVLDAFKSDMLENRKAAIGDRVAKGQMTQEQADAFIANMEANQANCDGTTMGAGGKMGQAIGGMFGKGQGQAQGQNKAQRGGMGAGRGAWGQGAGNAAAGNAQ